MELVRYDAMCRAIDECHKLDEVTDIHDKALAMQVYAKQAMNIEAERKATEVRLRAERKAGELMREMQRTPPKDKVAQAHQARGLDVPATVAGTSEYRAAIDAAGIPERTAQRWQQLANVPREVFESHLAQAEVMPTSSAILSAAIIGKQASQNQKAEPDQRMDTCSLWIWGRLRDFEREGYVHRDSLEVMDGMTETMKADVERIMPMFVFWAQRMIEREVA